MDKVACNRDGPFRWRSSIAVFEYEPPEDQQRIDGFTVSYLKVACTITGYQPDGQEIRIRERLARSGWTHQKFQPSEDKLNDVNLNDVIDKYHACYGAILEVVVAPMDDIVLLKDYPYFADFDPKKRELYEMVTETGEVMSRSLEDVNVRLGNTTSQSYEVRDTTNVKGELSGSYYGVTASGSVSHESGTTDISQRASENIRTTDAAREERETLSHTTQLSQMYHQLNSYHLGTNRAVFFVLPRPHVVQSTDPDGTPRTFVDGPRQIEGIQEFMLVVVRPKSQEHICVEAYLETAHRVLTEQPEADAGSSKPWIFQRVDNTGKEGEVTRWDSGDVVVAWHKRNSQTLPAPNGYVIDTSRGDIGIEGVHIDTKNTSGRFTYNFDIKPDHVTLNVDVIGVMNWPHFNIIPAYFELFATIYLKKASAAIGYDDTLLITGREVCSCDSSSAIGSSILYEKKRTSLVPRQKGAQEAMTIYEANRLGADIHREILQSLSSADRYPRGMVSLLDTQLVAGVLATHLRGADSGMNPRLTDWAGIAEHTLRRVIAYSPSITRSQMLEMPLAQQVENFGLSFAEAVELRRALTDLREPIGPRPVPEQPKTRVPDFTGLQLEEVRTLLASNKLVLGGWEMVDSPLPNGVVTGQNPQFGTEVNAETEVKLQVSSGLSVRLPDVLNLPLSDAMCQLREAGLKSEPTVVGAGRPDKVVTDMEPQPRSWVTPNSAITLNMGPRRKGETVNG